MWTDNSVLYQIYPLGFCGAPAENDGVTVPRIRKIIDYSSHLTSLGVNCVLFNPLFESDKHGYDTRDMTTVDCRLGTNQDFADVCRHLHSNGIKVLLDGVFNHVGRGCPMFLDVLKNRSASPYKDWFLIDFFANNPYNDGLSYDNWEGHYELVRLNLENREVREYIFNAIKGWVSEFDIDGIRIDVAYCIDKDFLRELRSFCDTLKTDFFLVGEVLFGDYNQFVNPDMLHSCTNYECYKGIYSSINDNNMFEISYSLNRQFGDESWSIYKGMRLLSFVDNHDVSRIASQVKNPKNLPIAYGLLFGMPGIPSIYYGSEWGVEGLKQNGDASLRPAVDNSDWNSLTDTICHLTHLRRHRAALHSGSYRNLEITNKQLVFERRCGEERIIVGLNLDEKPFFATKDLPKKPVTNILTNELIYLDGSLEIPAHGMVMIS